MIPALSVDLLGRLSAFATATFGLRFPPDRWSELARGLASAALELGISDLEGWAESLAAGVVPPAHLAAVGNHLTISETYFFRHPDTFVLLEREILPARCEARRAQGRRLRIWSAGCASGEEPYTVAVLLQRHFPELGPERTALHGTDLNAQVLARARRGVYTEWSFRDAPAWLKPDYFVRRNAGRYELKPEIRERVQFSALNLAAPAYPAEFGERADFDVILCRNVLMYFSADWQARIVRRLARALTSGGWLIVGPCDLTAAQAADLHLQLIRPGIYSNSGTREPRADPTVVAPVEWRLHAPLTGLAEPPPDRPADLRSEPSGLVAAAMPLLPVSEPAPPSPPAAGDFETARALADRGELVEALQACERALASDGLHPERHYLRGCILLELNRVEEAAAAFRRVLYLEPAFVMAEFALGSLAQRSGRTERARQHFAVVLRHLALRPRGEIVPHSEGLTVARLQEVTGRALNEIAA